MTGPARLDLLIPASQTQARIPDHAERFDDMLRKDEHRNPSIPRNAPREIAGTPAGDAGREADLPATTSGLRIPRGTDVPGEPERANDATDEAWGEGTPSVVRPYQAHLLGSGYLSTMDPTRAADAAGLPMGLRLASMRFADAGSQVDVVVPRPVESLADGAGTPFAALGVTDIPVDDGAQRIRIAYAQGDVAEAAPAEPVWVPHMARLTVSGDGLVTLWIRDFAASRSDIASRIADLRHRARLEGMAIGAVMVNGRPWNNDHPGKENDA